ncbi:hypothetical protein HMPREF9151_02255 [Hoylesella saccharolytica F0055]|uniref:Uncharacterized protein n=1 Tax=Hoylesella saccharolytica F0055 TaxID=1127699 RepID=L1N265_9BACT|nr:hypothetical protein HMPREF9151_02255 [Hoylesella saccharolytica F0055]
MLIVWKNERERYHELYLSSSKIRKIDHFNLLPIYAKSLFSSIEAIGKIRYLSIRKI